MENYYKEATTKTPEINFNTDGTFKISGNSYMEDPNKFYFEIIEWLKLFLDQNSSHVSLKVCVIYINTTSTKAILNMMNLINAAAKSELKVVWEYQIDDDEMLEMGENLQKLTKQNFTFQELRD